jgi:hypothetical protein
MRRLLLALTLAGLAAGVVAAPASAGGTTRMVDNDGHASPGNCGGSATAFKKVQPAVNASGPGDTVLVCPGTYDGRVIIGSAKDGLTLQGTNHLGATLRLAPAAVDGGVIEVLDGASDVTIKDLKVVKRTASSIPASTCGIIAGIKVEGTDALIVSNLVQAVGPGTLQPCSMHYGIAVGYDNEGATAEARYNIVKDFFQGGIAVGGSGSSLTAFRNIVRYYHRDADVVTAARVATRLERRVARSAGPSVRGFRAGRMSPAGECCAVGIGVFEDGTGIIRENTVASHPSSGPGANPDGPNIFLGAGILAETADDDTLIRGNRVYRSGDGIAVSEGLVAGATPGVDVVGNLVIANGSGIYIEATGGLVQNNDVYSNGYGIDVNVDSAMVLFQSNTALNNLFSDCYDASTGPGTDGTANTWLDNIGEDDYPDDICVPQT